MELLKLNAEFRKPDLGLAYAYRETLFLRNLQTPQVNITESALMRGIPEEFRRAELDMLPCFGCDGCIPSSRLAEHSLACALEVLRLCVVWCSVVWCSVACMCVSLFNI